MHDSQIIIHILGLSFEQKVQSKSSKVPVEQDIVVDLKEAPKGEAGIDLPHKEILSLRSLKIIPALPIALPADSTAEHFNDIHNGDPGDIRWRAGATSVTPGVFGNKNDILIETLRSIRSSRKIFIPDESSLYSPKSCPIWNR